MWHPEKDPSVRCKVKIRSGTTNQNKLVSLSVLVVAHKMARSIDFEYVIDILAKAKTRRGAYTEYPENMFMTILNPF